MTGGAMRLKRYRVVGRHAVDEHPPGAEFQARIPEWREQLLIRGGHIEVVPTTQPQPRPVREEEVKTDG